jgi:hypothetical protein
MNSNYPSVDHEPSYNTYSPYTDYPATSKLEAFDYNYWPTTHNLLANPIIDQIQTSPSTNQTIETFVPNPSVHLAQLNSSTSLSSTHHHHHIHQHLYPTNDSSNWLPPTEYQTPPTYRHYPYPNNNFYDQSQWSTPTSSIPIKFESPYTPPSYFESSNNLDQPLSDSKEEPCDSSYIKCQEQQLNWFKPQTTPFPPKNPTNGMSHF